MANNTRRFHGSRGPTHSRSLGGYAPRSGRRRFGVRPNGRRIAAAPGRIVGGGFDAARRVWPCAPSRGRSRRSRETCRTGAATERDDVQRGAPHHHDQHRDVRSGGLRDEPSRSADAVRRLARRRREGRAERPAWRERHRVGRGHRGSHGRRWRARRACPHSADLARRPSGAQQAQRHSCRLRQRVSARLGRQRIVARGKNAVFGTVCDDDRERARRSQAERRRDYADRKRRASGRIGHAARRRDAARRAVVSQRALEGACRCVRRPRTCLGGARGHDGGRSRRRASQSTFSGPRPTA